VVVNLAEHLLIGGVVRGVEFDLLDGIQLSVQLIPATQAQKRFKQK